MRYLIHSADGTYDAATGVTTHTIDQRWSNPTLMVVRRGGRRPRRRYTSTAAATR